MQLPPLGHCGSPTWPKGSNDLNSYTDVTTPPTANGLYKDIILFAIKLHDMCACTSVYKVGLVKISHDKA